jgi:5-methyltetrahydropteroyltriglutamate--homocysteine methyltransferase
MRSTERLLTTHTGSLPRPPELKDAAVADHNAALRHAVETVVRLQTEAGIDIVNDGEMSKPDYATYLAERASGFGSEPVAFRGALCDAIDHPEWGRALSAKMGGRESRACIGEVTRTDVESVHLDIENLTAAADAAGAVGTFLTAASPGVITHFLPNRYYPTEEAYLEALIEAMRPEYLAIHEAGITLQLDCPDLTAKGRRSEFEQTDLSAWKGIMARHIEALNAATADIPPEAMRMHLCWGNYDGPHTHDLPLREIIEIILTARPALLSFEAANPRHEHEWRVFEDVKIPEDKVLVPGVIDSTTNYVEHPELVAQRLVRFAKLVGRERVIAGTDCGFATFSNVVTVFPTITYAKLRSLAQGAELASRELW